MEFIIIGLGNLGKHYLSSIYNEYGNSVSYKFYDIAPDSEVRITEYLNQNEIKISYKFYNDFQEVLNDVNSSSVIISTSTVNNRFEQLSSIVPLNPKFIFTEKPVCRSREQYIKLLELSSKYNVPVKVNMICRFQDFYKELKSNLLEEGGILHYSSFLQGSGIACVGIHYFDLLNFLTNSDKELTYKNSFIYSREPQKRIGFEDIHGIINFSNEFVNSASLTDLKDSGSRLVFLKTEAREISIYEHQKIIVSVYPNKKNAVIKESGYKYISQYIGREIKACIENSDNDLADLKNSANAHYLLYEILDKNELVNLNFT